jgi:opacity protein-like surface antigen
MAVRQLIGPSAALVYLVAAALFGSASAQNYDAPGSIRFGGFLQGSLLNTDVTRTPRGSTTSQSGSADFNALGLGIAVGFDQRFGPVVLGVESDISFDDGSGKFASDEFNADYYVTFRGRLGFMLSQNWLLYSTAGWAMLAPEFKGTGTSTTSSGTTNLNKEYTYLSGWTVGGGLEYDYGPMVLFGEYLYTDFGNWGFASRVSGTQYSADFSGSLVRGGVKFKVGYDYNLGDWYFPR